MTRLTIKKLHDIIGITPDIPGYGVNFGPKSREKLNSFMSNKKAPALTEQDFQKAAAELDVPVGHIKGIRIVEAPRGAFDDFGRPTNLHERHKFRNNTNPKGKFDKSNPDLSGGPYGRGGYGAYSAQFDKFLRACSLDPHAAFCASSWGAFQVMGENYADMGYSSVDEMVFSLVQSEAAHLETAVRYVKMRSLQDELRACKANNPQSCVGFVKAWNGPAFAQFNYHKKFAAAIAS